MFGPRVGTGNPGQAASHLKRSPKTGNPASSQPHMHQQLQQPQTPGTDTVFCWPRIPRAKAGLLPARACASSAAPLPVREATASRTSAASLCVMVCLEYWTILDYAGLSTCSFGKTVCRVRLSYTLHLKNLADVPCARMNFAISHIAMSAQCQILAASWGHALGRSHSRGDSCLALG